MIKGAYPLILLFDFLTTQNLLKAHKGGTSRVGGGNNQTPLTPRNAGSREAVDNKPSKSITPQANSTEAQPQVNPVSVSTS